MPQFDVTSPDGKTYTVTAPDGATQDDAIKYVQQNMANIGAPVSAPPDGVSGIFHKIGDAVSGLNPIAQVVKAVQDPKQALQDAGNTVAGAVRGAGSIGATVMRALPNALGGDTAAENAQRRADMDAALQSMGADPASLAYRGGKLGAEVAGTAGVGGALANGVRGVAALAPAVQPLAGPLAAALETGGFRAAGETGIPGALARVIGGAGTGAASAGLVDPKDAKAGAVIGAVLPPITQLAGKLGDGALSLAQPFYESGKKNIIGNALVNASGNQAQDVLNNLRNAQALIPDSIPTAAEAAQNPGFSALSRAAIATDPIATNEMTLRQAANNSARVKALEDIAGTDGARDFHSAARGAAAQELYEKAFSVPIEMENLSPSMRGELTKLTQMPAIQNAVQQARTNAANYGMNIGNPEGSIMGLHQAKLAMDDQINKLMGGTAAEANKARGIMAARDRLVTFMEKMSPDYEAARVTYQDMSRPLNQMDVAQSILNKSSNQLTGSLYPNQFARVLSDDTARSATGFNGATLESVMTPEQLRTLNNVKDDLARKVMAEQSGRGVGSNTVQNLAYANILDKSGVPNFLREWAPTNAIGNLLGRGADLGYKRANVDLSNRLAMSLLHPQTAADMMQRALGNGASAPPGALSLLGQGAFRTAPLLADQ